MPHACRYEKSRRAVSAAALSLALCFCLFSGVYSCSGGSAPESSAPSSSVPSEPEPSSQAPKVVYCQVVGVNEGSSLNIRKEPSSDGEIIGKGLPGEKFVFISEGSTADWKKIRFKDTEGFVSAQYVSLVEE